MGYGIPSGTTISEPPGATSITISNPAQVSANNVPLFIGFQTIVLVGATGATNTFTTDASFPNVAIQGGERRDE